MLEEIALLKPEEVFTLPGFLHSSFTSAKHRAAPVVCPTLCHPVSLSQLQLLARSTSLGSKAPLEKFSFQPVLMPGTNVLENTWQEFEAF